MYSVIAMALKDIRAKLRDLVGKAWTTDKAIEFRDTLEDAWTDEMRREYRKAMTESRDPIKALREAAEKYNLDSTYRSAWDSAPEDLRKALYGVRDLWSDEDRNTVAKIVEDAGIRELYRLCIWGKYDEVKSKLGLKETPSNFAECARLVAHAKNLSERLRSAWR